VSRSRWFALGVYALLSLALLCLLLPLGAGLWGSLHQASGPERPAPSLAHYAEILARPGLLRALANSLLVAVGVTGLVLLSAGLGAYGLSRYAPPGTWAVLGWVISLRTFPLLLALIPLFRVYLDTGLSNTRWGIVLAQGAFILPFCFWLALAYLRQIPPAFYEAAEVDGASTHRVLSAVVLPLLCPGLRVIAFVAFVQSWNDYLVVSIANQSVQLNTLPFTTVSLMHAVQSDERLILALNCLLAFPPILLYLLVQRQLHQRDLAAMWE